MRIATTNDRALIENIVTHPDVLPFVSDDRASPFDATPYLSAPHIALIVEGGCFLGLWHGYGRVECHTNFLPSARGKNAIREARQAIDFMFLQTNCLNLVTRVPQNNPGADWFVRVMGFRLRFERAAAWMKNGVYFPVKYYELDINDWIAQGHCVQAGRAFHQKLHELLPDKPAHADDFIHDCYVGATAEMIRHGKLDKAVLIYNWWARFAGYGEISIISTNPLKINIVDCVLSIKNGDFAVEGR